MCTDANETTAVLREIYTYAFHALLARASFLCTTSVIDVCSVSSGFCPSSSHSRSRSARSFCTRRACGGALLFSLFCSFSLFLLPLPFSLFLFLFLSPLKSCPRDCTHTYTYNRVNTRRESEIDGGALEESETGFSRLCAFRLFLPRLAVCVYVRAHFSRDAYTCTHCAPLCECPTGRIYKVPKNYLYYYC